MATVSFQPPISLTDWTGQEILPGDYIVYPTKAKGGKLYRMGIGQVVEFKDKTKKGEQYRVYGTDMGWNHSGPNGSGFNSVAIVVQVKPLVNSHKYDYRKPDILIKSTRHIFKISEQEAKRLVYLRQVRGNKSSGNTQPRQVSATSYSW